MKFLLMLVFISLHSYSESPQGEKGHFDEHLEDTPVSECYGQTSKEEIISIVRALILNQPNLLPSIDSIILLPKKSIFNDLKNALNEERIVLREFESDAYYLKTFFKISHILRKSKTLFLDINKNLYKCSPPKNALIGILAHELVHLRDYEKNSIFQNINLGKKMLRKKSRARYERQTDAAVINYSFDLAMGLSDYRKWIYPKLTPKQLKTKRCMYYTPEEIIESFQKI